MEAHADIVALALVPDVKPYLDAEAEQAAKAWFDEYRVPIKSLSDERRETYRLIKGMSTEPEDIDLPHGARPVDGTTVSPIQRLI
jgi:type III restriction enzyme